MAVPIITWRKGDNTAELTSLELGTIDAGSSSLTQSLNTMLIWNNYAGATAVADAYDCYVGAVDTTGSTDNPGTTPQLITEKYVEIKDVSNTGDFVAVGYDAAAGDKIKRTHVSANGTTTFNTTPYAASPSGNAEMPYPILGNGNAGALTDLANFCKIDFHLNLPQTAGSGSYSFMLKFWYTHI